VNAANWSTDQPEATSDWTRLGDLAPHYDPQTHGPYVRALVEGIEITGARNVAVAGPYGSGKSSILDGLRERYGDQIADVSMATIRSSGKGPDGPSVNELEKEIVKQFLYVLDPAEAPSSRFRRVTKFSWRRAFTAALSIGAAAVAVQWIANLAIALSRQNPTLSLNLESYSFTLLGAALIVLVALRLTNGQWTVSAFSAGPAKLTLDNNAGSYFDDYLDEIVYFFQVSGKRIVVIEDMDRFNNVEIFEDLRALNTLLNRATQLQPPSSRKGRENASTPPPALDTSAIVEHSHTGPIVFVYAIRDSLFAGTVKTSDKVEHDAFARTKFFDLIVPVVPFVTKQNARGALKLEFDNLKSSGNSDYLPSDSLVSLVAQSFPDQRQIRNIRNEFTMYREILIRPGRHPKELTADRLLALIMYKNFEVEGFEQIRLGHGNLHTLLGLYRDLVAQELARVNQRLSSYGSDGALIEQARQAGNYVQSQAKAMGVALQRPTPDGYGRMVPYPKADLQKIGFWRGVVAGTTDLHIGTNLASRAIVEKAFRVKLDFAEAEHQPITEDERASLINDRDLLEQSTWSKLWAAPKFVLRSPGAKNDDGSLAPETSQSFAQLVIATMGEGLAADLIERDHLTQNFALLSATFDTQYLTVNAQDFLTRVLERPGRRPNDPLDTEAVSRILEDRGPGILERAGMVNIHVLNYVLVERPAELHRIAAQLRDWTEEDQQFVHSYFERYGPALEGRAAAPLLAFLAKLTPRVLAFVVEDLAIPESLRVQLFDAALSHVDITLLAADIESFDGVHQFAATHQSELESLRGNDDAAILSARAIAELGVRVDDVGPVGSGARRALVEANMFAINLQNLKELSGSKKGWVAMDDIVTQKPLYEAVLCNIDQYIDLCANQASGVSAQEASVLQKVLEDLATEYPEDEAEELLCDIVRASAPGAIVAEISGLQPFVQEALLREGRAAFSFDNLLARFESAGGLTEAIVVAVSEGETFEPSPADLQQLVDAVVEGSRGRAELLSPQVISAFILQALGVDGQVSALSVTAADPKVALEVINDEAVDMTALRAELPPSASWTLRERVLAQPHKPSVGELSRLLPPKDLESFLRSKQISAEVKPLVLEMIGELLVEPFMHRNATLLAKYLKSSNHSTDLEDVWKLARAGASAELVIDLACRQPTFAGQSDTLRKLLETLGGNYAALLDPSAESPKFERSPENTQLLSKLAADGFLAVTNGNGRGPLGVKRFAPR